MKTALAEETGRIQAMTERRLAESSNYLLNRIPDGTYNNSAGEAPRKVRFSTAPIEDRGYVNLLVEGNESVTMTGRDGGNTNQEFTVTGDRKGSMGCNIPGQTLYAGYDVFGRSLQGTAYETEEVCVMDLISKEYVPDYFRMLREDLPLRGREAFEYELERQVIKNGRFNTSMVNGFTYASGVFPAIPEGGADLATIRRLFTMIKPYGWTGKPEVSISRVAFETMRLAYKRNMGVELQSSLVSPETHFLSPDTTVIDWGDVRWVINDTPLRGWLEELPNGGGYKLHPVRPLKTRAGTGEGIVAEPNQDYYEGWVTVQGRRLPLYEVGFFHDPKASQRQAFAIPQIADAKYQNNLFNMQVRMISGAYLKCNEDDLRFKYRMLHAYGYESLNPELMGAFIYRYQPERIYVTSTYEECTPPAGTTIAAPEPAPMLHDACSEQRCLPCGDDFLRTPVDPRPDSATELDCQVTGAGYFRIVGYTEFHTFVGAGSLVIAVERVGGYDGAVGVDYDTTDGTADAGTDFTDTDGTLSWADGEGGRKYVTIPISGTGTGNKSFDFAINTATGGASLANGTTRPGSVEATVYIDPSPECEQENGEPINATAAAIELATNNLAPDQTLNQFMSYVTGTGQGGRITQTNVQTFLDSLIPEGVDADSVSWSKNGTPDTIDVSSGNWDLATPADRTGLIAALEADADIDGATLTELALNRWRLGVNFVDGATFTLGKTTWNAVDYPIDLL
jgi:hypothetical protein